MQAVTRDPLRTVRLLAVTPLIVSLLSTCSQPEPKSPEAPRPKKPSGLSLGRERLPEFSTVCSGTGRAESPPYTGEPGFHRMLVMARGVVGHDRNYTPLTKDEYQYLGGRKGRAFEPDLNLAKAVDAIELVLCLSGEQLEVFETCDFVGGKTLELAHITGSYQLLEAKTARELASGELRAFHREWGWRQEDPLSGPEPKEVRPLDSCPLLTWAFRRDQMTDRPKVELCYECESSVLATPTRVDIERFLVVP